jgi:hypothetical protein
MTISFPLMGARAKSVSELLKETLSPDSSAPILLAIVSNLAAADSIARTELVPNFIWNADRSEF